MLYVGDANFLHTFIVLGVFFPSFKSNKINLLPRDLSFDYQADIGVSVYLYQERSESPTIHTRM